MPDNLIFNCGEFRPGKKPIGGPGPRPGPKIIIKPRGPMGLPPNPPIVRPPVIPLPEPRWKCVILGPVDPCPPPGFPTHTQMIRHTVERACFKCTLNELKADLLLPPALRVCIHKTKIACEAVCQDIPGKCGPPHGPITPGPIAPGPSPVGKPVRPGPTTPPGGPGSGPITPGPVAPPPPPVVGPVGGAPTTGGPGSGPVTPGPTAPTRVPGFGPVRPGPTIGGSGPVIVGRGDAPVVRGGGPTVTRQDTGETTNFGRSRFGGGGNSLESILANARDSGAGPQAKGRPKQVEKVDLYKERDKSLGPGSESDFKTIYDPEFNLTTFPDGGIPEGIIPNTLFPNIFKEKVPYSVGWALRSLGSSGIWHEQLIEGMTPANIALALQPDLLMALDLLRYPGGLIIDVRDMLDTIRTLILTNRISEFDPEYFLSLAADHQTEDRVSYIGTNDVSVKTQAALGIINSESTPANPEVGEDAHKPMLRKHRYLNTDLDVTMPVATCDGNSIGADLYNEGLQVVRLANPSNANEDVSSLIELAEGGGYYLSATLIDDVTRVVVDASTQIQDAYRISPQSRSNALSIIGEDNGMRFTVTSTYAKSEFGDDYDLTSVIVPMYFKLSLSTVGSLPTSNPIVSQTSAVYERVTDVNEINIHARSNGFDVLAASMDYEDPFLVYANNSSSMELSMRDITFNNFYPSKGNIKNTILPRTTPFGIILYPGRGSKHNPFGEMSELVEWEHSVRRSASFIPHIDTAQDGTWETTLEKEFSVDVDGVYRVGLFEPIDVDNVVFKFETSAPIYQDTYYSSKTGLSSTAPTRVRSAIGKMINRVIDNTILARYEIPTSSITWYDVFRRLSSDEIFEIMVTRAGPGLSHWLSNGGRGGVKIGMILNRAPIVKSGLGSIRNSAIEDLIFLNDENRKYDAKVGRANK